jgi:hypothetical protein
MSLILGIITHKFIVITGDLLVTDIKTGKPLCDDRQKIFIVNNKYVLSYTKAGDVYGTPVSSIINDLLKKPEFYSLEAPELLNNLVAEFKSRYSQVDIVFTATGFDKGIPFTYTIGSIENKLLDISEYIFICDGEIKIAKAFAKYVEINKDQNRNNPEAALKALRALNQKVSKVKKTVSNRCDAIMITEDGAEFMYKVSANL